MKLKKNILPWIVFHCLVVVLFLISVLKNGGVKVNADLFSVLPSAFDSKALSAADKKLTAKSGENVIILVSSEDFAQAKESAETVYEMLLSTGDYESLSLYSETASSAEIQSFLKFHRNYILPSAVIEELSTEEGRNDFSLSALNKAYGNFSFSGLDSIYEDPFLLDEVNMENYFSMLKASGTSMSPKEGVLCTKYEGKWYVMINGILTKEASAMASDRNGVKKIFELCTPMEKDGVSMVYSGTPFHTYESSSKASREITIITIVSLTAVLLILLFVFRTPLPIIYTFGTIIVSGGAAFAVTHVIFDEMNLLSLVFGTSLIGSCIDYSLHFFVSWKGNGDLKDGTAVKNHLIRGLTFSLISTEICYVFLSFAPFTLLKQMAVFSFTGILSSFLSVMCIYPLCKVPTENKRSLVFVKEGKVKRHNFGLVFTLILLPLSLITVGINHKNIRLDNNISNLYQMQGRLKDDAILSSKVLNYNPSSWFIVCGDTVEEVLENEEEFASSIPVPYISVSRFIPSRKMQESSFNAVKGLNSLAYFQMENLGFDSSDAEDYVASVQFKENELVKINSELPKGLESLRRNLWIGEIDGRYYSIMIPVSVTDSALYSSLADGFENVYFENKVETINSGMDRLSGLILKMFAISFGIIFVMLLFFYDWKKVLRIMSVPLVSSACIFAYHSITGAPVEFFSITGMILVFGLGLDYIIYSTENNSSRLEKYAIILSFITTAISFGALALSSFVPVHTLGLSIFIGLTVAFLSVI